MPDINILTEADLRGVVGLDLDSVACVEEAFRTLATKSVAMPPILSMEIADHNGEVDVKTAYLPGLDSFAIKMSPGFFDNPKIGLPSVNGLMVVFSARTGLVEALLLDNGYLTDLRTAAAGAVAAKWLAREDASRVGILGTGAQARLQLEALTLVRPIAEARLWGRDAEKAAALAGELSATLGLPVTAAATLDEVVAASDIVVTTTPASTPLIEARHLRPGLHITAMGSDTAHKNEIAPAALAAADLYVCDRQSQCALLGELRHALAAGLVPQDKAHPELGSIIAGKTAGRPGPDAVTLCDLTGTGAQDTAIATLARSRAEDRGAGTHFRS
ncbi:MAG TPA: ectoine utilization protein EutC [Kiloniellaceae bacterium]|nr:ectoine utilization protein EutC [Kiloniellaceae bacterium]